MRAGTLHTGEEELMARFALEGGGRAYDIKFACTREKKASVPTRPRTERGGGLSRLRAENGGANVSDDEWAEGRPRSERADTNAWGAHRAGSVYVLSGGPWCAGRGGIGGAS